MRKVLAERTLLLSTITNTNDDDDYETRFIVLDGIKNSLCCDARFMPSIIVIVIVSVIIFCIVIIQKILLILLYSFRMSV